jgi:hypothetical protein
MFPIVRDMCVLCIFILHKGAFAYCTCTYGSSILSWYQSLGSRVRFTSLLPSRAPPSRSSAAPPPRSSVVAAVVLVLCDSATRCSFAVTWPAAGRGPAAGRELHPRRWTRPRRVQVLPPGASSTAGRELHR